MNKDKERNLLEARVVKSFLNLIDKSTFHGIPNVFRGERRFTRLMWLVFTLFSIGLCSWFCFQNVINYLSFNKVTYIDFVYEEPML